MMALVSELNQVIADALNYPPPTVAIFSRRLRDAGLISKKGRGRGAAHATPLDGARLLIALLANSSAIQAPECVRDFGGLIQGDRMEIGVRVKGEPDSSTEMSAFTIEKAYGLSRRHTFEEAIAAIIAGYAEPRPIQPPWLEIIVHDTALSAAIRLAGNEYHYTYKSMIDVPDGKLIEAHDEFLKVVSKYERGIDSRRSIRTEKLQKIAAVINGQSETISPSR